MITVEKAQAMVKEFEDNRKNEIAQRVKNFCDTVVSPAIEENAKVGKRFVEVEVDPHYIYEVSAELKQQGWGCSIGGTKRIEIRW
jgi:hypothetical protein